MFVVCVCVKNVMLCVIKVYVVYEMDDVFVFGCVLFMGVNVWMVMLIVYVNYVMVSVRCGNIVCVFEGVWRREDGWRARVSRTFSGDGVWDGVVCVLCVIIINFKFKLLYFECYDDDDMLRV